MDIVERLRGKKERVEIPCPDNIKGCAVFHFRLEVNPDCAEAADEIERLRIAVNDLSKENGQLREVLFKLDRVAEDSYGSPAYGSMASSFVQSIVSKALLGEK